MIKKITIITLLFATQLSNAVFWTHVWNNTNKDLKVYKYFRDGHLEMGSNTANFITHLIGNKSLSIVPKQTGKTVFFQNRDALVMKPRSIISIRYYSKKSLRERFQNYGPYSPSIDKPRGMQYRIKVIGRPTHGLVLLDNNNKVYILPNDYPFFNKYLEVQKEKNNLKIRWYFGLIKGKWKVIKPTEKKINKHRAYIR